MESFRVLSGGVLGRNRGPFGWSCLPLSRGRVAGRAEASGRSMKELLGLSDAELRAIMQKSDAHRGRDLSRYAFMQDNLEEYAR